MKKSSVLVKYKWVLLALAVVVLGGSVYAYLAMSVVVEDPGVMYGPENHPLNVELTEIQNKQVKCFQDLNKQTGKDESYRPEGVFESLEYAATCVSFSDLVRAGQIQSDLQKMSSQE
uniref:Uncharacterized protein n=1 Tax=viral metagenome TaxID=1070528 RepID=A0A6C0F2Z4_9ZZZZ